MARTRVYTQQQYDDAVERISKLINLDEIKNIQELDRKLKKEDVYLDVRGGQQTIYDQLVNNFKDFVEPEELVRQEQIILKRRNKPALSKRAKNRKVREIKRLSGITYYKEENKVKVRQTKKGVQQYILHQGRYHNINNIIVYQRSYTRQNRLIQKWFTRRKPRKTTA